VNLEALGWNEFFASQFKPYLGQGYSAGRVSAEFKHLYNVITENGELISGVSGRMRYETSGPQDFPAVGDWVVISGSGGERATIHAILPRQSKFSRKMAGKTVEEQVIASNIETIFLVSALNNDFNPRRIERYLFLAWESGANPVIILNKADLCHNNSQKMADVGAIAPGVPIHVVSCVNGAGLAELNKYLGKGHTVALLGSSGAGKSTLSNCLLGKDIQKVNEVRSGDDHGRHTTTHGKLIPLPWGALLIDTPGLRELQLWGTDEGLEATFSDIEFYAEQCQFDDCQHQAEPNCAVKKALSEGKLDNARYESYQKLQKELDYLSRKENIQEYLANKAKWKKIMKIYKHNKHK